MTGGPYDEIRERISCLDAARQYGLEVRRDGFCLCLFHNDKKPSLKLYDGNRGFFCFACSEGGDVIKLTGQLLGLDRVEAARQLNRDFNLRLPLDEPPTKQERAEAQRRREMYSTAADFQEWVDDMTKLLSDAYYIGWSALRDIPETLWFPSEIEAIKLMPTLECWLDLLGGDLESQMTLFRDRERVRKKCMKVLNDFPERFKRD